MTNVCELVVPSEQFRDSYSSYIAELEKHGEKRIPFPLRYPHEDFPPPFSLTHKEDLLEGTSEYH